LSRDGRRHIVTLGGGFLPTEAGAWRAGPLIEYVLGLARPDPQVCVMNTAVGDEATAYVRMVGALLDAGVRVRHLALFPMPTAADPRGLLLEQDAVIVGGGSVANLCAVWRVHGLDDVFREAWNRGVVLSGASAGAICWFAGGPTDSFGRELRVFSDGLALLPHSYCPHYDSEERRRPAYQRAVGDGSLPDGWATDDGVALHFVDDTLADVVSDREGVRAWRVERSAGGHVVETALEPRLLTE